MGNMRRVCALILDPSGKPGILLNRSPLGWHLPFAKAGAQKDELADEIAISKDVLEETGLNISLLKQLCEEYYDNNGPLIAYLCEVLSDQIIGSTHHFVTLEEARQGFFLIEDTRVPLELYEDHMGILFDGLSVLGTYTKRKYDGPLTEGIVVNNDAPDFLLEVIDGEQRFWIRQGPGYFH